MAQENLDLLLLPKLVVHPGGQATSAEPVLISTLLGSCIAVCLYDPINKVAGMNHFLLASKRYAKEMPVSITEAGRYGIHAMELLINDLLKLGAERKNFRAKVFGGGSVIETNSNDNFMCVGEVNSRFIKDFLSLEKIKVESMDVGGVQGRVIKFRTDNYTVYRRLIKTTAVEKLETNEYKYWKNEIKDEKKTEGGSVFLFNE